jgi:hypothetical protein
MVELALSPVEMAKAHLTQREDLAVELPTTLVAVEAVAQDLAMEEPVD